jgi:hypothetical protein
MTQTTATGSASNNPLAEILSLGKGAIGEIETVFKTYFDNIPEADQQKLTTALSTAKSSVETALVTAPTTVPAVVVQQAQAVGSTAESILAADTVAAIDKYIEAKGGVFAPEMEAVANVALDFAGTTGLQYVQGLLKGKTATATATKTA